MSAVRPVVLVYQDFASVSVPVATADLNVLVVGPCYDVYAYPDDKATAFNGTFGVKLASGSASIGAKWPVSTASQRAGGKIEDASRVVWVDEGFAELSFGTDGTVSMNTADLTRPVTASTFITDGVAVGDRVLVNFPGAKDTNNVPFPGDTIACMARTVLSVSAQKLSLSGVLGLGGIDIVSGLPFTVTAFPAANSIKYRVERPVAGLVGVGTTTIAVDSGTANITNVTNLQVLVSGALETVTSGKIYMACRSLRGDLYSDVDTVSSMAEITGKLGKIDEKNPLAVGVSVAFANSNKPVQFVGIQTNDAAGYIGARDAVMGRRDIYAIVPLTQDIVVITMWKNHCMALAAPEISKFRIVIGSGTLPVTKQIYPADGTRAYTITGLTLLDQTAGFMTAGVSAGDSVLVSGAAYVVDSVLNNNQLLLKTAPAAGTTYAISRTFTHNQQVTELAAVANSLKNPRCTMVWPDQCFVGGLLTVQPGYYIACAVGGMVAGLPPHQGFTFISMAGISRLVHSNTWFFDDQLTALSNGGWFVVVQDTPTAAPYTIHELTTDVTTLESGELMVVKNFDFVSTTYRDALIGFLGQWNVSPDTLDFLKAALDAVTSQLTAYRYTKIGAPLLSGSVSSINVVKDQKDQVEAFVSIVLPRPLNRVHLHLKA